MIYSIRQVDGRDPEIADEILKLHDMTFGDTAPSVPTDSGHWWLAYCGDAPVAFAGLVPARSTPDAGYMIRVGVMEMHRGQGLQKRLIRVRQQRARLNGWTRLVTDTTNNPASANALISAGFRMYEPQYPWGLPEALYWKKEI